MSFAELKRSKGNLDKLLVETEKLAKKSERQEDDRFWRPTLDKAKNGSAVIRFLPAPEGEDVPWVRLFSHGFKGPNGLWYIENSLTTLGQKDPVSEYNTELWNSGIEANKNLARNQKRRLQFISNILVVRDPAAPENEGKIFLFKYGKKIFDKINDVMHPQEDAIEDVQAFNPFDLWTGANFKLRVRYVEGYVNYDKSEFGSPSPLSNDDAELESTWKKEYKLSEFISANNFKNYDELKSKLERVLGSTKTGQKTANQVVLEEDDTEDLADVPTSVSNDLSSEDDDDLSYIKRLAEED